MIVFTAQFLRERGRENYWQVMSHSFKVLCMFSCLIQEMLIPFSLVYLMLDTWTLRSCVVRSPRFLQFFLCTQITIQTVVCGCLSILVHGFYYHSGFPKSLLPYYTNLSVLYASLSILLQLIQVMCFGLLVILTAVLWPFSSWFVSLLNHESVRLMEFRFTLWHDWCLVLWACFANDVTLYFTTLFKTILKICLRSLCLIFVCMVNPLHNI